MYLPIVSFVSFCHTYCESILSASREENSNWRETTTGVFADKYWTAIKVEIATLESMGNWEIFYQDDSMKVIDLTWDFKCKSYSYG